MKKRLLTVGLTFGTLVCLAAPTVTAKAGTVPELFNPRLTDSLLTTDQGEINSLVSTGWENGFNFSLPSNASTPVYRLYNPNAGQHYFTTSASERDGLVKQGWRYEKIAFYSGGSKAQYVYYNPSNGAHFYGIQMSGTVRQGIAFYTN